MGADEGLVESLKFRTVCVNGRRGLMGVDVLLGKSDLVLNERDKVDVFSREFVASNIDGLRASLLARVSSESASQNPTLLSQLYLSHSALAASMTALRVLAMHLSSFTSSAEALRTQSVAQAEHFVSQALVMEPKYGAIKSSHTAVSTEEQQRVASAVTELAKKEVSHFVEEEMGWTGMVLMGRVDDLADGVASAVRVGWGGEGQRAVSDHLQ